MKDNIALQVLIATYGSAGLKRLAAGALVGALPKTEGVGYLISCQMPEFCPIPEALRRDDIQILFSDSKGLSKNRNILLSAATAPYCLIADDDLSYTASALHEVIQILKKHPDVDIATFISANAKANGEETDKKESLSYEKNYPSYSFNLRRPTKGYYITSFEIAFRRERVISCGVLFNENFGVGAPLYAAGEEELWVHELLGKGLQGWFFPQLIAVHHGPTTGTREAANPRVLRAQGVVIPILYPLTGLPRLFLKAYRSAKVSRSSILHCLRHILHGYSDLLLHKNRIFPQQRN